MRDDFKEPAQISNENREKQTHGMPEVPLTECEREFLDRVAYESQSGTGFLSEAQARELLGFAEMKANGGVM